MGPKVTFKRNSPIFLDAVKNNLFLNEVRRRIGSTTLVGELFACFLDYRSNESRDIRDFNKLSKRCFDMALATYPELKELNTNNRLWDDFKKCALLGQGWESKGDGMQSSRVCSQNV